jgi:ubiquinone/menaquinone biosynthesis C-methylase UbiE
MSSINYFNEVAGQWDRLRQGFFPSAVREKIYAVTGCKPGESAADIGAGTGFVTEGLAERGLRVISVDFAREMIRQMELKFMENGQVDCRLGESESLPVEDNTVDYAVANMYLHHVENPATAIAEMARIVKPGGKVVITDLDQHTYSFLQTEQKDRWMGFLRSDILKWYQKAGLQNIDIDCVSEHCCASSECSGLEAQIRIFIASGEKPGT